MEQFASEPAYKEKKKKQALQSLEIPHLGLTPAVMTRRRSRLLGSKGIKTPGK